MPNQKIKILTDSACDISKAEELDHDIKVMCFPVTLDGKSYRERQDFTNEQFYQMMDQCPDIPRTAQITQFEFMEEYQRFLEEGITDVIHVTICQKGSNTYGAAQMARNAFYEEHQGAEEKMKIHILDSRNYTGVYGYAVVEAARKAEKGASAEEIISFLEDWFDSAKVLFAAYTLEYVKKSGRVSCAAAFVGEVLGLRPLIRIEDGVSSTLEKVRGDKNILPRLMEAAVAEMVPQTPYIMITGSVPAYSNELAQMLTKRLGYPPEMTVQVGAAVAANAGHKVAGVVVKGKHRS